MTQPLNVGLYVFDDMTMLDAYGPLQILSFVESFNTFTFGRHRNPFRADCGVTLTADHDLESCPPLDIMVVAGGGDVLPEMQDAALLDFLREQAKTARYVTSVCTGALILAEAGLLDGYRATTHWAWRDDLARYPEIEVVDERVAVDRNRLTGGGITAGIDFALTLIAEAVGPEAAMSIQLVFEYRPEPPFDAGAPERVPAPVREAVTQIAGERRQGLVSHLEAKFDRV